MLTITYGATDGVRRVLVCAWHGALEHPGAEFEPVDDKPFVDGCGWENAVRLTAVGGAQFSPVTMSCPAAAALAMWVIHGLQPAALKHLQREVDEIAQFGSYACRNIRSASRLGSSRRSEHASALAIDIKSFRLDDGGAISVLRDWETPGERSRFLKAAHRSACRYFRVVLGPDANALHRNHLHLDRGWLWTCR